MGRDEQSPLPHFTAPPPARLPSRAGEGYRRPLPSYELYLLHATALYLASPLVAGMNVLAGHVVVVALTYGLAELVRRLHEAPMSAWIRERLLCRHTVTGARGSARDAVGRLA
jgi:peptidoglycan/LPS O-acetylase OafA/YrhL